MKPLKLYKDMKMDQEEVSLTDIPILVLKMEQKEMMKMVKAQKMELVPPVDILKMQLGSRY